MRFILTILFIVILNIGVFAQIAITTPTADVTFRDADPTSFEVKVISDTIFVKKLLYEGLDGTGFEFSPEPTSLKVQYELGFLQYTVEDNPAWPLDFSTKTKWLELEDTVMPDFYGNNKEAKSTHSLLGYESRTDLAEKTFRKYFEEIKSQSIDSQTYFFSQVLSDPKLEVCCEDYIEPAEKFLNSNPEDLNSIEDLSIEFIFKSTLLEAIFEKEAGKSQRVLIRIE